VKNLDNNQTTLIWKDGGYNYGDQWNYGQFGFGIDSSYVVIIEGTSGIGIVAIDDLFFKESQYCSIQPVSANAGGNLPLQTTTRLPTTVTPIPSVYDCNFEVDFCNWENDYTRPLNWTRNRGSTTISETGPSVDHT
jgi:hypothetical protein